MPELQSYKCIPYFPWFRTFIFQKAQISAPNFQRREPWTDEVWHASLLLASHHNGKNISTVTLPGEGQGFWRTALCCPIVLPYWPPLCHYKLQNRSERVTQRCLRWLGHLTLMDDGRIAKDILYGELASGKRPSGHLRHNDVCKRDLKPLDIDVDSWETLVQDRNRWLQELIQGLRTWEVWRIRGEFQTRKEPAGKTDCSAGQLKRPHSRLANQQLFPYKFSYHLRYWNCCQILYSTATDLKRGSSTYFLLLFSLLLLRKCQVLSLRVGRSHDQVMQRPIESLPRRANLQFASSSHGRRTRVEIGES